VAASTRAPRELALAFGRMSWHWRLEDASGATVGPAALDVELPEWDNQSDAESWLGENWRELLSRGVATATLLEGDTEIYGPMGLAAE
jgi:hypothetical protein